MRILMAGPGKAIALRRVVDWACQQGHEVCLVAGATPYQRQAPTNFTFVRVDIDDSLKPVDLAHATAEECDRQRLLIETLQLVAAKFRPNLIHLHHLTYLTDLCVKAGLKPLVVSAWGMLNWLFTAGHSTLPNGAMHDMLAAADSLIVESPALLQLCGQLQPHPAHVALIPLGTNPKQFQPASPTQRLNQRRMLGIDPDTVVLLSPRGWSAVYRQEQILMAYQRALPQFEKRTQLLFLRLDRAPKSKTVQLYAQAQQRVTQHALTEHVRWLPELVYEMMPTVYNVADIVINYPRTDAFPSTIVEAVACERPVITAHLPSYRGTFIEDFCTLVASDTPALLTEAMVRLVNDSAEKRTPHLQNARQHVIDHYDETIAQQRLSSLYETIGQARMI